MILAKSLTLSATAVSLASFNFAAIRGLRGVQLQATGGTLNYGPNGSQPFTLAAGLTSDVLPVANLNDLYVRGTGANVIVYL